MEVNEVMEIVKYHGEKFKKVFDDTDSINACDMCCFCGIDNNGLPVCDAPNEDRFYGCGTGKFHWEKANKENENEY